MSSQTVSEAAGDAHVAGSMRRRRTVALAWIAGAVVLFGAWRSAGDESAVADAVMRGDSSTVRLLLKQGADVNAAQADGMTALHWAATRGDANIARMLTFAGARLDATTRNGNYSPLHMAARAGRAAAVTVLLEAGADSKALTSSGGAAALHFAASNGDPETVKALLDKGADVDIREGAWSQTPLMWAASANRVMAAELLIARGANIEATSKIEDISARERSDRLALTARARRVAAIKAAEAPPAAPGAAPAATGAAPAGAATAATAAASGSTPAAAAGAAPVAAPAAPPVPAGGRGAGGAGPARAPGDTTRPATGFNNRGPTYGDLIGNKGGLTPLLFAVRDGSDEVVDLLLKSGAKINHVSDGDKTSPLLMATINGRFDMAMMLLAKGSDPKLASEAGATPLYSTINVQWAAKSLYPQPTAQLQQRTTHLELMEALIKAGADVNVRLTKHLWYMSYNFDLLGVNTTGATPFWRAAYGTDVPAMKLLIKYGADPNIPTLKPVGRLPGDDSPPDEGGGGAGKDPSGLAPIPAGGPGVYPIHAASGVGYGEGFAANSHRHAPDGWLPSVKYLVEELKLDINQRDHNGYNAVHHAAARGDNQLIDYLRGKGGDIMAISRRGQTTVDMANGPVQRIPPFLETVEHLTKLGAKNSNKCMSC
ncbi:MAG: ankyrin repeat domain-containing protein [Gemmatimonadaceae bacterium]|nr:ankyrin repeat domain-containing protein [Gemmatimonadaceae bacterium]